MNSEEQLRAKLRKIEALFAGAGTDGERLAAAAALERIKARLTESCRAAPSIEMTFSLPDRWSRQLFVALCRRYGLAPYRYRGQRYTTVVLQVPELFVRKTLWPEYRELSAALDEYLSAATDRIIREEVYGDAAEPEERAGQLSS